MISVKMRVKYFYAASEIILLLRENNRPSGVKGCFQETVLSTHMNAFLDRKERTGANTVDSCTMLRLGLSTLHSWKSACSFPLYSRPFWPFTTTDSRKGHGKQGFLPTFGKYGWESEVWNPRSGIHGRECETSLGSAVVWIPDMTERADWGQRVYGPQPARWTHAAQSVFFKGERHRKWTDTHCLDSIAAMDYAEVKSIFFNRKLSR